MWDRAYGNNLYVLFFLPFWKKWLKNYWHFVTGKTAKSILISCGARLAPFDIAELREIMSYDEMELDKIGDRKTALFLIMSDTDQPLTLWLPCCSHSFSICFAIRQMMNMVEDFRCMCVSSLTSLPTSDKFLSLISWLQPSEAGKSLLLLFCSHRVS